MDSRESTQTSESARGPERRIAARRRNDAQRFDDAAANSIVSFREAKARAIAEFESVYVRDLLQRAEGNVSLAARLAGKERSRFNRLVRKYHIVAREFRRKPAS